MGYFIAYRQTGADPERLRELLPVVRDSLEQRGRDVYCTYFDDDDLKATGRKTRENMDHAFSKIEEKGGLFVVIDDNERSEGMLMEVGYCVARELKLVVAKRKSVSSTNVHNMTELNFEYDDIDDLKNKILAFEEL